jgi:hypothetical protein
MARAGKARMPAQIDRNERIYPMLMQFDAATRVGAVALAALRMFQESAYEARQPYADILDAGGLHKKALSNTASAVDAICEAFAHSGALVIDTEAAAKGTRALYPDETAGGQPVPGPSPRETAMLAAINELLCNRDHLELHRDDRAMLAEAAGIEDPQAKAWRVRLTAEGIDVTAHDEEAARRHALADAREFMAQNTVTLGDIEPGDASDAEDDVGIEVECMRGDHTDFTFAATYTVTVLCPEEEAEEAAREILAEGGEF